MIWDDIVLVFLLNKASTGWWFQPIWKIWVKLEIFPNFRGENKNYLSCHHLAVSSLVCDVQRFRTFKAPKKNFHFLLLHRMYFFVGQQNHHVKKKVGSNKKHGKSTRSSAKPESRHFGGVAMFQCRPDNRSKHPGKSTHLSINRKERGPPRSWKGELISPISMSYHITHLWSRDQSTHLFISVSLDHEKHINIPNEWLPVPPF